MRKLKRAFPLMMKSTSCLLRPSGQYNSTNPSSSQQEIQIGTSVTGAVANDRQVVSALEMAVKAFKKQAQGFNGPLGFAFFEWLDDADRNGVLCGSGAATQAAVQMMDGNKEKAASLLQLARSCSDASTLIYTVSENAGSLYQRYLEAEQQLAVQATEVAEKCTDILKKNAVPAKK